MESLIALLLASMSFISSLLAIFISLKHYSTTVWVRPLSGEISHEEKPTESIPQQHRG